MNTKSVMLLTAVAVSLTLAKSVQERTAENFVCRNGLRYVENDCNGCTCSDGLLRCTYMACEAHMTGTQMRCLTEPIVPRDGEQCWCVNPIGKLCATTIQK